MLTVSQSSSYPLGNTLPLCWRNPRLESFDRGQWGTMQILEQGSAETKFFQRGQYRTQVSLLGSILGIRKPKTLRWEPLSTNMVRH